MTPEIEERLIRIKKEKPFVLNITSYFALDLIATGIRSVGALPIMSNAEQEVEELLLLSRSVVINIGKLDSKFIKLCNRICRIANEMNKPIILDPIGAGASQYRADTALDIIKKNKVSIIRGYPNEIIGLTNHQRTFQNSDSIDSNIIIENAKLLSNKYNIAVVVSGKLNTVIDGNKDTQFNFDSTLLHKVAGVGSLLSSIIGVFHAIETDRFIAATTAVEYYAICVGIAKSRAGGPASFKTELIDQLYINSAEAGKW